MNNKPFTAALEILEPVTDKVLSRRVVGSYETEQEALIAAFAEKKTGEVCCIGVPAELFDESEYLTAKEMADNEVWMLLHGEL